MTARVAIAADPSGDAALRARALGLAEASGLAVVEDGGDDSVGSVGDSGGADVMLALTVRGLEARVRRGDEVLVDAKPLRVALGALDTTSGPGRSLRSPIMKAAGLRKGEAFRPRVLDMTAGFGEDAWLLAAAGCEVVALERCPAVFALLRDGLDRAGEAQPGVAARVALCRVDAAAYLGGDEARGRGFDVAMLDPMFPARRRAGQRKAMRLARLLAGDDADSGQVLAAALAAGVRRVLVKRPRHAPELASPGPGPVASHATRAARFDIYAG